MKKLLLASLLSTTFFATNALAVAALPTTGTCGFTLSASYPFIGVQANSSQTTARGSLNFLGTLSFTSATAGTFVLNSVQQDACGSGATNSNITGCNVPGTTLYANTQNLFTGSFAVGTGRATNFSMLTLTPSGGGSLILNAIATNNGNTILLQKYDAVSNAGGIGVCQF